MKEFVLEICRCVLRSTPGTVNSDEGDLEDRIVVEPQDRDVGSNDWGRGRFCRKRRGQVDEEDKEAVELPHPKIKCSSTGQYCMEINLISESQRVECSGACAGGVWEVARWPPETKN